MQNKSSRPIILSNQFATIHTSHTITLSKAGSKDLRGVTFAGASGRELDRTTIILRYASQPDGTIPRERITYETEKMAKEAHSLLKEGVNKGPTSKQRRIFNALLKAEDPSQEATDATAKSKRGRRRTIANDQGLRRFLGVDVCP